MISNIKIFLLCPVPEDQKPINEYIENKENFLFAWTTFRLFNYLKTLIVFYIFLFSFNLFLEFTSFSFEATSQKFLYLCLKSLVITSVIFIFYLVIIIRRWTDIKKRFLNARLFYEEASWFDGQIWEKPFFLIKNDKLIVNNKIKPIIKRVKKTIFFIATNLLFLSLCLNFL